MNSRRVHDLMQRHFPRVEMVQHDWILVADEGGVRLDVLKSLLDRHIVSEEILIEVHRRVGDLLPRRAALDFIATHIGQGDVRITDREFKGFVVVLRMGVATGWGGTALSYEAPQRVPSLP